MRWEMGGRSAEGTLGWLGATLLFLCIFFQGGVRRGRIPWYMYMVPQGRRTERALDQRWRLPGVKWAPLGSSGEPMVALLFVQLGRSVGYHSGSALYSRKFLTRVRVKFEIADESRAALASPQ